ncbi:MAG: hypothetical protein AABX02_04980 [archaeon]
MREKMLDGFKVTLLLAATLVLLVVFVFSGMEGLISQMNRQLTDALVYYLVSVAALTGILWAYARSKQLIRAMPIEE